MSLLGDDIRQHFGKPVLIDANLLIVLVVGGVNPERIRRFKHTNHYGTDDYTDLVQIVAKFSAIVSTPNILTEVSNLLGHLGEPERGAAFDYLASVIERITEHYVESRNATLQPVFTRLGLTDAAVLSLRDSMLVLTDDFSLRMALDAVGALVLDFKQLKNTMPR